MKLCRRCGVEKPLSEFNKERKQKDGYTRYCRQCKEAMRTPNKYDAIKHRINRQYKTYGLTAKQVLTLFEKAQYKCQLCGSVKGLSIDHDHTSLQVRGILCEDCNRGLGIFKDSIDILQKAIEYLRNSPTNLNMLVLLNGLTSKGGL
jgi:5-methylcytosine-specific restriction endonuclease McrA